MLPNFSSLWYPWNLRHVDPYERRLLFSSEATRCTMGAESSPSILRYSWSASRDDCEWSMTGGDTVHFHSLRTECQVVKTAWQILHIMVTTKVKHCDRGGVPGVEFFCVANSKQPVATWDLLTYDVWRFINICCLEIYEIRNHMISYIVAKKIFWSEI